MANYVWDKLPLAPNTKTARIDFVIAFHQLSKRRPDCHQVRIIKVVVRIPSVSAADDIAGNLTHGDGFSCATRNDLQPRVVVTRRPSRGETPTKCRKMRATCGAALNCERGKSLQTRRI
jgi:hypothetical protein